MEPVVLSTEMFWLVLTVLVTSLMWIPYVLNRIRENGLVRTLGTPGPDTAPRAPWANRCARAHANAVENLVLFAPLVLAVEVLAAHTATTALACLVYFVARVVHFAVYALGIPGLRTLAFTVAWLATVALVLGLLGWI